MRRAMAIATWCVAAALVLWTSSGREGARGQMRGPVAPGGDMELRQGADEPTKHTILLGVYQGPTHVAEGAKYRDIAVRGGFVPADQLLLVHKEDRSELYLKRTYKSIDAAHADLMKAKTFRPAGADAPVFRGAITIAVMPEEVGPPEWNLKGATWEQEYTVWVGEFEDSPKDKYVGQRMKDSVKYCQELRKLGFEAYYYHGPAKSLVTIGVFPETSIKVVQIAMGKDSRGQLVPVMGQKIADPRIEKILLTKDPPLFCLAWNGRVQYDVQKDAKGKVVKRTPVGSQVIQIPRSQTERTRILQLRQQAQERRDQERRSSAPGGFGLLGTPATQERRNSDTPPAPNPDRVRQPEQVP